jgi:hypothetical protein
MALALAAAGVTPAFAVNLVQNGSFETNDGNGQVGFNTSASGWSVPDPPGSYTFLFAPGTADTTAANGQYGFLGLWGPGNGVANGLPATSPDGGYYIAQDSAFQNGAISQTINGLTPGQSYTVGFWWGAAQQEGFFGGTASQWQVSLGADTQSTAFANIPSLGFSGWMYQTFTYTATSPSEVLSFFASGGPAAPPFALLDGVSLQASGVPEPSTWAMLLAGFTALGYAGMRKAAATA